MENIQAYGALLKVAQNNGVSLEEVIKEIEIGIQDAIETAKKENNQAILDKWKNIPCAGDSPTAVELITYIGSQLK